MILTPEQLWNAHEYISKSIAQAYSSGRLPSLRNMMEQSHCSRTALEQVIAEYVSSGHLVRKAKSGYYLNHMFPASKIIELVACHDEGYMAIGIIYECMLSMINIFGEHGYSIRLTSISQNESIEKYLEISRRPDAAAFVLLAQQSREVVSTFQLTGKPVVSLFSQGRFLGVNQLIDSSRIVSMQMNHLLELGHTRILYLREKYKQYQGLTETSRFLDYYRIMAEHGLQVPTHWHPSYPCGKLNEAMEMAFSKQPTPTALIICDLDVVNIYNFLKRHNLTIGKDVSVIATDGISLLDSVSPSISTTVASSSRISQDAWELLERQFKGSKGFECREVDISFRQGESSSRRQ